MKTKPKTKIKKVKAWASIPDGHISTIENIDLYDTKKDAKKYPGYKVIPVTITYNL